MESERKSRITVRARLPKVNALAAARFMQADEDTTGKAAKKAMPNPMVDDRFKVGVALASRKWWGLIGFHQGDGDGRERESARKMG